MIYFIIVLVSFFFMEFVAWFSHKYVMHGFMWSFHRDHHIRTDISNTLFEKNDLFFLIYATPAIILMITSFIYASYSLIFIGIGITLYGFTYFLIHDVLIHHRLPLNITFRRGYFAALIRAHQAHHSGKNVKDFKNYGLLIFPLRFFKE